MSFSEHLKPYARLSPANLGKEYASKHILITGGGYGIGASIARAFAEARVASIVLVGRTESKLKATAEELGADFPETSVQYRIVDISSAESVKHMFDSLTTTVDVLVNNAGFLSQPENFVNADLKEWWLSFEINVLGTATVTQGFLQTRTKSEAKDEAVVVNLNTLGAYNVLVPNLSAYGASKAASWRMMELISTDVSSSGSIPGGVRVVNVHPGYVQTAMAAKSGLEGAFPPTDPQLAAEFIAWSVSDEAEFLANRFAWVGWDVDELVSRKAEIVEKDLLRTAISM